MTIRVTTLLRSVVFCAAILLCVCLLPIHGSEAAVEKPAIHLDENEQALILLDPSRGARSNPRPGDAYNWLPSENFFWLYEDEIRFIHSTYSYLTKESSNYYYGWRVGQETVAYLGEAPLLYSSDQIETPGEAGRFVGTFLQTNGCLFLYDSQERWTFHFSNGKKSFEMVSIAAPEDIPLYHIGDIVYDEDDMIVMLMYQEDDALCSLFIHELSTGEYTLVKNLDIKMIAPYKPGELLVYHEGVIKTYALKDGSMGPAIVYADEPVDTIARSFAYDHQTDSLYYLLGGDLYRLCADGTEECLVVAPTTFYISDWENKLIAKKNEIRRLLPLSNGQLAYTMSDHLFVITPTPVRGEEEVEYLVLFSYTTFPESTALYHLTHPHLSIESYLNFTVYVMEDPWCDVFQLSSNDDNFQALFREGYTMELSGAPAISEKLASYIQDVRSAGDCPIVNQIVLSAAV